MNRKFFVQFETAKLLKEKGYPQENQWFYVDGGNGITVSYDGVHCESKDSVATPTYHEVVDWLGEKGITIVLDCWFDCKKWSSLIKGRGKSIDISYQGTREEALNAAILKALEMI